jgi:hypothetical protein
MVRNGSCGMRRLRGRAEAAGYGRYRRFSERRTMRANVPGISAYRLSPIFMQDGASR